VKTEYIALTPLGFAAAVIAGILIGATVNAPSATNIVSLLSIAAILALHVRNDARQPIGTGSYRRTAFLAWRLNEESRQTILPDAPVEFERRNLN
jgi:hypothetical protein